MVTLQLNDSSQFCKGYQPSSQVQPFLMPLAMPPSKIWSLSSHNSEWKFGTHAASCTHHSCRFKVKKKLQMKAWEKNIGARICESKYLTWKHGMEKHTKLNITCSLRFKFWATATHPKFVYSVWAWNIMHRHWKVISAGLAIVFW